MQPSRLGSVLVIAGGLAAIVTLPACEPSAFSDPGARTAEPADLAGEPPDGSAAADPSQVAAPATDAPAPALEIQDELLRRWNAVAVLADTPFDFRWMTFQQFPHPTYKGGSAEAYGDFASVLLAFLEGGDNFDFLAGHGLFVLRLVYVFPSGGIGLDTTFEALVTFFATPGGHGDTLPEVRAALQAFADRIRSLGPSTVTGPLVEGVDYATMCRHYCGALEETVLLACVERTGDVAACVSIVPAVETCYEARCVPRLVPISLCFTQCDSLRAQYDRVCGNGTAHADLCGVPSDEHDRLCRDGCAGLL